MKMFLSCFYYMEFYMEVKKTSELSLIAIDKLAHIGGGLWCGLPSMPAYGVPSFSLKNPRDRFDMTLCVAQIISNLIFQHKAIEQAQNHSTND